MDTPNFDLEIEALLEAKINYHKEQAKFHAKMAATTRDSLRLLMEKTGYEEEKEKKAKFQEAMNNISSSVVSGLSVTPIGLSVLGKSLQSINQVSTIPDFSVTTWKPKVEKVLRESVRPYKTEDILREINPHYLINEDMRKKAIGVISSSLFALVQNGKVIKMDNKGSKGNLYIIADK